MPAQEPAIINKGWRVALGVRLPGLAYQHLETSLLAYLRDTVAPDHRLPAFAGSGGRRTGAQRKGVMRASRMPA